MLRADCCCSAAAVFAMVWRRCGGEYCGLCFRRACLRARGVRSPRHCALTAQALRRLGSASRRCASRLSRSICVRSWPRCLRSTSGGWSRCPGGARCLCEGCDPASRITAHAGPSVLIPPPICGPNPGSCARRLPGRRGQLRRALRGAQVAPLRSALAAALGRPQGCPL